MATDPTLSPGHDGFLSGQILIAMPGIGDPRFERGVVLVCAHDEHHAMGLAVNRPVEGLTLPDLLTRLDIPAAEEAPSELVLMGGPVERERGFVLHTDDYSASEASVPVAPGVTLTATRDVLAAMASHQGAPRRSMMALGYAGWGAGQLESEIAANGWLTCRADMDMLFDTDIDRKYDRILASIGVDLAHLSVTAGHA
mgnify:CR=1 FL=1